VFEDVRGGIFRVCDCSSVRQLNHVLKATVPLKGAKRSNMQYPESGLELKREFKPG
jgi:hypothetical protein